MIAPSLVRRYGKGTDSDATDAMVVNALDSQGGGPDDNSAQAGRIVAPLMARSSRGNPQTLSGGNTTDSHLVAFSGHGEGEADTANAITRPSRGSKWKGNSSDTFAVGDPKGGRGSAVRRLTPT